MDWIILGNSLLIFALRMAGVSLGTIRMIMISRGRRKIAPLLGFVESIIWVVAISHVVSNLGNIYNILGYSGGFAAGTLVGMWIEDKLALGYAGICVVSLNHGSSIANVLRQADFGVTELIGRGQSGTVSTINTIVRRKYIDNVFRLVNKVDPGSFISVDDMTIVKRGHINHSR